LPVQVIYFVIMNSLVFVKGLLVVSFGSYGLINVTGLLGVHDNRYL